MNSRVKKRLEFHEEEGYVRLNLRRPINIYLPTDRLESYNPKSPSKKPNHELQLDWVYGYRGRDCRNNVRLLASNEIAYFVAAVGVIYHLEAKTQRHYAEHTDDIKSLAVHPNGKIVATGQVQGRKGIQPHVRIWDSVTLETLHVLGGDFFKKGVVALSFSNDDGQLLAAVDDSREPVLSVWHWENETKVADSKAAADPVIGVKFSQEHPSRIVTNGKGHLAFWTLEDDSLKKKNAVFGTHAKPKFVTTVSNLPSGEVVSGDSNGSLMVWKSGSNTVTRSVKDSHSEAIFTVFVNDDGRILSSGKDRKIAIYDDSLSPTNSVEIPEEYGSARCALWASDDIVVGTTSNNIIKMNPDEEVEVITRGNTEELWGMAIHPSEPQFMTAGQDGNIYLRNLESHELIWSRSLQEKGHSVGFSPNGNVVVVGSMCGKWIAIELESQEVLFEGKDGEEPIQVTRFSPSGEKLALGSRDNSIYIYKVEEDGHSYTKVGACQGHSSFITHLDWSADGQKLKTNSGDYEVLFWNVEDCSQLVQKEDFRDVEWATNTCILSFESVGIWPPGTDGTDINSVSKANGLDILASGDDFGHVKLFTYPATSENAKNKSFLGHSSHVTTVTFTKDDSTLISVGGRDTAALQWKVLPEE